MHPRHIFASTLLLFLVVGNLEAKELKIGKKAPEFTLTASDGKVHNLKDYRGKYVVLEWINYDCPFVRKHYKSENMQTLQKRYTAKDVVWLSICSSAPGKQGNFSNEVIAERSAELGASHTAYLIDADGMVGKWYDAKTTPHMFVIDPEGRLVYMGGIDDIRSTDVKDIPKATNYVAAALDASMAGKKVAVTSSKPYGCGVKY